MLMNYVKQPNPSSTSCLKSLLVGVVSSGVSVVSSGSGVVSSGSGGSGSGGGRK